MFAAPIYSVYAAASCMLLVLYNNIYIIYIYIYNIYKYCLYTNHIIGIYDNVMKLKCCSTLKLIFIYFNLQR